MRRALQWRALHNCHQQGSQRKERIDPVHGSGYAGRKDHRSASAYPRTFKKAGQEVTIDMAASLNLAVRRCFPKAHKVIDRFHVQQLAFDAVQEVRIQLR